MRDALVHEPDLGSCKMGAAGGFPEGQRMQSKAELRDGKKADF